MKNLLLASLLATSTCLGQRLSPLAERPDWKELSKFDQTITRGDFVELLTRVYSPDGGWRSTIEVRDDRAVVQTRRGAEPVEILFAASPADLKPLPIDWTPKRLLPPRPTDKPLEGIRITIDPGHLGGEWARMEDRWFQIGRSRPVVEGDMTLLVAKLLKERLESLGAEVALTRSKPGPVTSLRPDKLRDHAHASLVDKGKGATPFRLENESELLFYRVGEIRQRAKLVNGRFDPDLVLCLHFNAEPWGNPARPTLVDENHLHFLVTGAFSAEELSYEDQRFNMLYKLLSRTLDEEVAASDTIARSMAKITGLPPYTYRGSNAVPIGSSGYVWARNLLANRLFECPVVYVEPYVMNSREVFARVQAGDYPGTRVVAGKRRPSIYREYVEGITQGLLNYYAKP